RSMHSSQMYTPGPAMSLTTCFWLLPQKEHLSRSAPSPTRAISSHLSAVVPWTTWPSGHSAPSGPGRPLELVRALLPVRPCAPSSTIRRRRRGYRPVRRVSHFGGRSGSRGRTALGGPSPRPPVSGSLGQLGRRCLAALQHLVDQT